MKVYLGRRAGSDRDFFAGIETHEGEHDILEVRGTWAAHACRLAAAELRAAADRFDLLAEERNPCAEAAHARVNDTP